MARGQGSARRLCDDVQSFGAPAGCIDCIQRCRTLTSAINKVITNNITIVKQTTQHTIRYYQLQRNIRNKDVATSTTHIKQTEPKTYCIQRCRAGGQTRSSRGACRALARGPAARRGSEVWRSTRQASGRFRTRYFSHSRFQGLDFGIRTTQNCAQDL